ncbi:D-2-hydroxyacid dehydrogenase [Paenibacillus marinisediminis]
MDIAITVPLKDEMLQRLQADYPEVCIHKCKSLEDASERALQSEVLVAYNSQMKAETLNRMPNLRWIQAFSAGVDNLPLHELEAQSITVTTSSGAHKIPMAEFAFGLMLQEVKSLIPLYQSQQQAQWNRKQTFGELDSMTIAILGTGAIGEEIARRAKVFGMQTIGVNRSGRKVEHFDIIYTQHDTDKALVVADFVIVVAPLTSYTRSWLNENSMRCMKPEAVLMNLGRGELIDEQALILLLQERAIKKAYLDVFQIEPLPADSPLWTLDNCIVTPHISAISERYNERCLSIFMHNLNCYRKQETMMNIVEAERGY